MVEYALRGTNSLVLSRDIIHDSPTTFPKSNMENDVEIWT